MPSDQPPSMMLVMGVTGVGKSYFINQLVGHEVVTSGRLSSCTQTCRAINAQIEGCDTIIVDTPGFGDSDSKKSDAEILTDISKVLTFEHQLGAKLKGIIYLHRITDVRFQGSSTKTLTMFKEICGDKALPNVILVTTRWQDADESVGAARETELRQNFYRFMLALGSNMARFRGDKSSALGIVGQLLGKPDVVLKIQEELQDGRPLQETIAGKVVQQDIQEKKRQHEETLQELEELRESQKNPTRYFIRRIFMRRTAEEAGLKKNIEDEKLLERKLSIKAEKEIEEAKAERRHKGFIPTILAILGVLLGIVNAAQENMPL